MEIITVPTLASYLDKTADALAARPRAASVVDRTNALVTSKWANPVEPAPPEVVEVALAVAARALGIDPSKPPRASVTKTSDGTSRTERFVTATGGTPGRDVFLTAEDLADLNPTAPRRRRPRSLRIGVPGATV